MNSLPFSIGRVGVPPIKCQGIKTKLVPFVLSNIAWSGERSGRWIEPFLGSGVVAFNLAPERALLSDTNKHIIGLYAAVYGGKLTTENIRQKLVTEGRHLSKEGEKHFYRVRERFNAEGSPYDFIFLNRSCFNGLMRFNARGEFNVPFCRKTKRFSNAYISKIVNQVGWMAKQMRGKKWEFHSCEWSVTLAETAAQDFVYLDPPYIGRHTDYFNRWGDEDAKRLATVVQSLSCGYALSMWHENKYRSNGHIGEQWKGNVVRLHRHFYHVGSLETLRNEMIEALVIRAGFAAPTDNKRKTATERVGQQTELC